MQTDFVLLWNNSSIHVHVFLFLITCLSFLWHLGSILHRWWWSRRRKAITTSSWPWGRHISVFYRRFISVVIWNIILSVILWNHESHRIRISVYITMHIPHIVHFDITSVVHFYLCVYVRTVLILGQKTDTVSKCLPVVRITFHTLLQVKTNNISLLENTGYPSLRLIDLTWSICNLTMLMSWSLSRLLTTDGDVIDFPDEWWTLLFKGERGGQVIWMLFYTCILFIWYVFNLYCNILCRIYCKLCFILINS